MKQVETSQILDVETAGEIVLQFDCSKPVKAERNAPTIAETGHLPIPRLRLTRLQSRPMIRRCARVT
jgi:hypothetical protein